ncbi:hypothetical protein GGR50DRAFT_304804 [Xylaria sp. CBS 124048]|nr:hypothetical protein GGR50DRAFT_304804 [Xylaria sp. CBS 124048]
MAEPTNTPMPTAPPTRSSSPAPPLPTSCSPVTSRILHWPQSHPQSQSHSHSSSNSYTQPPHSRAPSLTVPLHAQTSRPLVLLLGDTVQQKTETYAEFISYFEIVRPSAEERSRAAFIAALRQKKWGDFAAIMRLSRTTGGEMGDWDAELIALLPDSMRVFASNTTESDGWTDKTTLGEKGIVYCDAGFAAAEATADFATAQIISTFRALPYCIASATSPESTKSTPPPRRHNLRGQVLGLVGFGDVGQQIARRCAVLGMQILYHDDKRRTGTAARSPRARYVVNLEALVRASDCVVLCDFTKVFDRECLRWMKKGARLVSVSGSVVDQEALADSLESGWLAGVALDVRRETAVTEPLRKFLGNTALITCCDAFGAEEMVSASEEEDCMRNVLAVLVGDGAE